MIEKPFIMNQPIQPIGKPVTTPKTQTNVSGTSFSQALQEELRQTQNLKFSRHAQERLDSRRISLDQEHLVRLQEAVEKADSKGCRESLVVLDDLAFVVSIKNRTVITAVDGDSRKENVFTNIDSAVIN